MTDAEASKAVVRGFLAAHVEGDHATALELLNISIRPPC